MKPPDNKSNLFKSLITITDTCKDGEIFDCTIYDGGAFIHVLQPKTVTMFKEYAEKLFFPYMKDELHRVDRIDVVWDSYKTQTLKEATRLKRGTGVRRKVATSTKIPKQWIDFLRNSENKKDLFLFLSSQVRDQGIIKAFYMTECEGVVSTVGEPFPTCDHEEADTRVVAHALHTAERGYNRIVIRTSDTDIIVIMPFLLNFQTRYPNIKLFVAFGVGKYFQILDLTKIFDRLGSIHCKALPFFHAFTGYDSISAFHGRGKTSCFRQAWRAYGDVSDALIALSDPAFRKFDTATVLS